MPISSVSSVSGSQSSSSAPPSFPVIKAGSKGALVMVMQRELKARGFFKSTVTGTCGPKTIAAIKAFQQSKKLGVDGAAGPMTWRALGYGVTSPLSAGVSSVAVLRQNILAKATAEIGTMEGEKQNTGPAMKYSQFFGRDNESWCSDFLSYIQTKSGRKLNIAYVPALELHLKVAGQWKGKQNPLPGDIVVFDQDADGTPDHTGIFVGMNPDGTFRTIEGNTDNPQTGIDGVWAKTRTMAEVRGFANP